MRKHLILALALMICAGVFFFPITAYAAENIPAADIEAGLEAAGLKTVADTDADIPGDVETSASEESESGIPPYDGPKNITPDGSATVIDNVFIEGNGLEVFTFTTGAGNTFYLVIDRMRTQNNVYFLNAVTEQDLIALAEKDGTTLTGTSGIPSTPGTSTTPDPSYGPETPEGTPANKGGIGGGTLIFILIGIAVIGGVAFYIKILRPKQQRAMDDEDDAGYGNGDDQDYDDDVHNDDSGNRDGK